MILYIRFHMWSYIRFHIRFYVRFHMGFYVRFCFRFHVWFHIGFYVKFHIEFHESFHGRNLDKKLNQEPEVKKMMGIKIGTQKESYTKIYVESYVVLMASRIWISYLIWNWIRRRLPYGFEFLNMTQNKFVELWQK